MTSHLLAAYVTGAVVQAVWMYRTLRLPVWWAVVLWPYPVLVQAWRGDV